MTPAPKRYRKTMPAAELALLGLALCLAVQAAFFAFRSGPAPGSTALATVEASNPPTQEKTFTDRADAAYPRTDLLNRSLFAPISVPGSGTYATGQGGGLPHLLAIVGRDSGRTAIFFGQGTQGERLALTLGDWIADYRLTAISRDGVTLTGKAAGTGPARQIYLSLDAPDLDQSKAEQNDLDAEIVSLVERLTNAPD